MSERITPEDVANADIDTELPYILFDYYLDAWQAGEIHSRDEAIALYLADIAQLGE